MCALSTVTEVSQFITITTIYAVKKEMNSQHVAPCFVYRNIIFWGLGAHAALTEKYELLCMSVQLTGLSKPHWRHFYSVIK